MRNIPQKIILVFLFLALPLSAFATGIDSIFKYAWGENIGWLNWGTPEGAVDVGATALTGYVWGENVGWVSLNCSNTSSCGTVDYKVSRSGTDISGYAWGENVGWISFSCANTGSCGTVSYGVTIDASTGVFSGYAWGENVGWVSLNCSNTSSCGTVDYKVGTSGTPPSGGSGGGGIPGGGSPTPTPTNSPSATPLTPDITISKVPSASSVTAGSTITYSVTVRNNGGSAATGVVVSDTIDPQTTLQSVTPTPAANNGSTSTFNVGTLGPGGSFSYTSRVRVNLGTPPGTTIDNTVRVTGDNFTQVTAISAVTVVGSGGAGQAPSPSPTSTFPPTITPPPAGMPPPVSTPPVLPPPATPTAPPPSFTPPPLPGPIVRLIDRLGQLLDYLSRVVFGGVLPPAVTIGSVIVTLVTAIPALVALASGLFHAELFALFDFMFQIVGLKRKPRVWGVVYDSRTKHPLPFAKLQLLDSTGRVMETRFADRDGRYGFLISPTSLHEQSLSVRIAASKPGYLFPSRRVLPGVDFIVYEHPYYGDQMQLRADSVLKFDIPLDPGDSTTATRSAWGMGLTGPLTDRLLNLGFIIGLFLVPLNYIWYPTMMNLIIGIVFFGANAIRLFALHRPYGIIRDASTGKTVPYALVTLNDMSGRRVAFAVSDERGRYFLPAERGAEYSLIAYTPANVVPQRMKTIHITAYSRTSRHAWVTLNISL